MPLRLHPITLDRFASWAGDLNAHYAQSKVDAGQWPAEGALERATREQESLLPQGLETPGHDLFVGTVDGEEVGLVWLFTDPELAIPETFIYAMDVNEKHRGHGHGRELLEAAERWCAEQGVHTVRLHVFDDNLAAVNLYETSGFETRSRNMSKRIR